jgi:hypothetical protein
MTFFMSNLAILPDQPVRVGEPAWPRLAAAPGLLAIPGIDICTACWYNERAPGRGDQGFMVAIIAAREFAAISGTVGEPW